MAWDFNIDFTYQANALIRRRKRKPQRIGWLLVIINQLKVVHELFLEYRAKINREMRYNAQIMMLESALNFRYYGERFWATLLDPTAGGHIWISNTANFLPNTYIYSDNENQSPEYIYFASESEPPVYTYFSSEYASNYDYIIMVPVALTFTQAEMRAFVDQFNLAGMKYIIQTY